MEPTRKIVCFKVEAVLEYVAGEDIYLEEYLGKLRERGPAIVTDVWTRVVEDLSTLEGSVVG